MTRISRSSRQMLVVAYPRLVIHDVQLPDKERDDTSDAAWEPQLYEVVISVRVYDAEYRFVVVSNTWKISVLRWGLIPRLPVLRPNYGELFCQESAVHIHSLNSHGIGLFKLHCGYRSNDGILKIVIQGTSEINRRSLPGPGRWKTWQYHGPED